MVSLKHLYTKFMKNNYVRSGPGKMWNVRDPLEDCGVHLISAQCFYFSSSTLVLRLSVLFFVDEIMIFNNGLLFLI
jgi:hypothetical protein